MHDFKKGDKVLFVIKNLGQEECEVCEENGKLGIYPSCGSEGELLALEEFEKCNDMSIKKIKTWIRM